MIQKFKNKKIGIWGFGIVGKSALSYFEQYTNNLQILDTKQQSISTAIVQTSKNTQYFLENNDYILASPGIKLHTYEQYKNKFITEADIFQSEYHGTTIAITGTLGKTTITTLLQQLVPNSIAAGNIGHAMLNIINQQQQPKIVVLELSSFQLHYTKKFAPDIAILSNFYPNHLDHHQSEQEYWQAKCNIFKYQTSHQITLLPCNLLQRIQNTLTLQSTVYLFCSDITCTSTNHNEHPTFIIKNNNIVLTQNNVVILNNISQLPKATYQENWLIITAALYLQHIPLNNILQTRIKPEPHRLEYITTIGTTKFYDDSKSTVWQATKQAVETFDNQSCILFLGGLSKGTDRSPLITHLSSKNITVIAFGKEAETIKKLCDIYQIPCSAHHTLEHAFDHCISIYKNHYNVIFSPAGSSFDLFTNYIERGNVFKNLVHKHQGHTCNINL